MTTTKQNGVQFALVWLAVSFVAYAVIDTYMEHRLKKVVADTQELISRIAMVQAMRWPERKEYRQTNIDGSVFFQDTNGTIHWYRSVTITQASVGDFKVTWWTNNATGGMSVVKP